MTEQLNFREFEATFETEISWVNDLIVNQPLYSVTKFSEARAAAVLYQLKQGEMRLDCHCNDCGKESVFRRERGEESFLEFIKHDPYARMHGGPGDIIPALTSEHHLVVATLICQRVKSHGMIFIISFDSGLVQKVGQMPSLEDIAGADIERFRKILDKSYFQELRRAGGLASHGVGIGAFVYLRRIFEKLIFDHYSEHKEANGEINGFETLRMDEKIAAIAPLLPKALVANKVIYSILSKGIHALSEEECRNYFPIVKSGIVAILEQDLAEKERADADKRLAEDVARLAGKLKN